MMPLSRPSFEHTEAREPIDVTDGKHDNYRFDPMIIAE